MAVANSWKKEKNVWGLVGEDTSVLVKRIGTRSARIRWQGNGWAVVAGDARDPRGVQHREFSARDEAIVWAEGIIG